MFLFSELDRLKLEVPVSKTGGGDVRRAAIRALPTKQSKTGSSSF